MSLRAIGTKYPCESISTPSHFWLQLLSWYIDIFFTRFYRLIHQPNTKKVICKRINNKRENKNKIIRGKIIQRGLHEQTIAIGFPAQTYVVSKITFGLIRRREYQQHLLSKILYFYYILSFYIFRRWRRRRIQRQRRVLRQSTIVHLNYTSFVKFDVDP